MAFWVNYIIRTALILEVSGLLATPAGLPSITPESPVKAATNSVYCAGLHRRAGMNETNNATSRSQTD